MIETRTKTTRVGRRARGRFGFLIALAILSLSVGCGGWPFGRVPGPMRYQQNNASLHDPYFDNDLAPEVVGGRPREFQKPRAEPVRSRMLRDSYWNVGR